MHFIGRRSFVRGIGLGAGAGLLSNALSSILAEAQGKPADHRRVIFFTDGNGWCNQGEQRNQTLLSTVRSPNDFDLPAVLEPLTAYKSKLSIVLPMNNPHGTNQHGNSWSTLSVVPMQGNDPGGISIDRFIGSKVGTGDPFSSMVVGLSEFGNLEKPAVHASADGAGKPVAAFNTPVRAFAGYIAGRSPVAGASNDDIKRSLALDKSILDGVCADVDKVNRNLVGFERQKFDQLLESCRGLERQLAGKQERAAAGVVPMAPDPSLDKTGLDPDVIKGHIDVTVQALALGMSHVAHISLFGRDAYNDSWKFLQIPFDSHEGIMHGEATAFHAPPPVTDDQRFNWAVDEITRYKAKQLAYLYQKLAEIPEEGGTMADNTLIVWLNSGGGKHHNGTNEHAVVLLGGLAGRIATGRYLKVSGQRAISDLFVSVAQAMGVVTDTFGDPAICKGSLL